MRNRIVRTIAKNKTTTYKMTGFMVTEKMKRDLRARGIKTDTNKWSDVFKNGDVVYRFNPRKGKLDIFVGDVFAAKYPSGKNRHLKPRDFSQDVELVNRNTPESHRPTLTTLTITPAVVVFGQ